MSNEEVKEEVEKVPEEVEEVSKKVTEEVQEEVQAVAEEVEQKSKRRFTDIKKLKCDYTVYKRERTNLKMPIIEKCQKCGKQFKDGDELYTAYTEKDNISHSCLICKECTQYLL